MEQLVVISLVILFGIVSGASGGAMLSYVLVKEMRRFEKKYAEKFLDDTLK